MYTNIFYCTKTWKYVGRCTNQAHPVSDILIIVKPLTSIMIYRVTDDFIFRR